MHGKRTSKTRTRWHGEGRGCMNVLARTIDEKRCESGWVSRKVSPREARCCRMKGGRCIAGAAGRLRAPPFARYSDVLSPLLFLRFASSLRGPSGPPRSAPLPEEGEEGGKPSGQRGSRKISRGGTAGRDGFSDRPHPNRGNDLDLTWRSPRKLFPLPETSSLSFFLLA